jgi:hypothetical protein
MGRIWGEVAVVVERRDCTHSKEDKGRQWKKEKIGGEKKILVNSCPLLDQN